MFEVNGTYANRKGKYTVLAIDDPRMTVRFEDGTVSDLSMPIQARIWENIQAEEQAREATRTARRRAAKGIQFYTKSLSVEAEEDLSIPGWRERITVVPLDGPPLRPGDRILYFAVEDEVFFAVATIIGEATEAVPKGFFFSEDQAKQLLFYPIDLDEQATILQNAVRLDSVELESLPDYRSALRQVNSFHAISEDDFELLAELLTEVTEEEDEEFEDDEEEEYED